MFEHRSHKVDLMVVAVAVLAIAMVATVAATDVDAAEGESIEYRVLSAGPVVIYDSSVVESMVGEIFEATVTDSSGNGYTDIPENVEVFFATVSASGCVISLNAELSEGLYNVHIYTPNGVDLYNGPLIVGELSLVISENPMTVRDSATFDDILTATPEEIADRVSWTSDDPGVLRITDTGVEAVGVGKTTLTVTYHYLMRDVVDTAEITVNPIKVSSVTISGDNSVREGESIDLSISVDEYASGYTVGWSADPATAVRIDPNADGSASITGESVADSVTIKVTVTNFDGTFVTDTHTLEVQKVPVESIEITTPEGTELGVGGTTTLEYAINPDDATDKTVTWQSYDSSVATVDADGTIHGITEGTVTITVTSNDNKSATDTYLLEVTIVHAESVTLNTDRLDLKVGAEGTLTATVNPTTAGNRNVAWSSSDEAVAKVVDGRVTAVGLGEATITVTTVDGGHTATCVVNVVPLTFTVSFESEHGRVHSSVSSVAPGGTVTFTIEPNNGYVVESVSVNGGTLSFEDGVYTISDITADVTVTIVYVPDVIIPPIDDDDDYVPIPPVIDNSGSDDDTTAIVACAAAAVVAALIAVFLIMEYRKR